MISRRDVLRAVALGGGVVAGELWVPGARVISIPRTFGTGFLTGSEILAAQDALNREAAATLGRLIMVPDLMLAYGVKAGDVWEGYDVLAPNSMLLELAKLDESPLTIMGPADGHQP